MNNLEEQANSKNCGPPPGNKFDLLKAKVKVKVTTWYQ